MEPMPIGSRETLVVATVATRTRTGSPSFLGSLPSTSRTPEGALFMLEALPAVTRSSALKVGFSLASFSRVVSRRTYSSVVVTVFSLLS